MQIIILAGGLGTRIAEETETKPKPMVLIHGKPIIWHLMSIFADKGYVIDEWILKQRKLNDWNIQSIDTGLENHTGGRISICMEAFPDQRVLATYGDGLANISISALLAFHKMLGKFATVTAVRPPARFGVLKIKDGIVKKFSEKNQSDVGWINGGFFVLEPEVRNYISSKIDPFESGALVKLTEENQLAAYQHHGFWKPMDTLRDKNELEVLAKNKKIPWMDRLDVKS
jgi:glucose-1-phosphate cytidylyltransferase